MADPKLLYAIPGVKAFHIVNGTEEALTPAGPQTLSLLMVPTSSGYADPSSAGTGSTEEDFYLHLHLPPELDLPLPATTQIYYQPPKSYLIPRWDLGPESGAFTRLEFPSRDSRPGVQEDVDTFETILAQCTAFLERAVPPRPKRSKAPESPAVESKAAQAKAREAAGEQLPAYDPSSYNPGEAYVQGSRSSKIMEGGRIVLIDEEDGSVVGELSEGFQVVEQNNVRPGSKDPVEITLPQDGSGKITVQPASEDFVKMMHPAYKKSTLVNTASRASTFLMTTSAVLTQTMQSQAEGYTKKTEPAGKPVTFNPTTHAHIRRINTLSGKAAGLSSATVGSISKVAQNFGAGFAIRKDGKARGYDKDGNVIESYRPGVLNKSLMAFNTVVDGMEQAGRTLLTGTSSSVATVVGHRWGEEAGQVAAQLGGGVKNVGLVYIDVTGVSRRAIVKSLAKGMIVGKVKGGEGEQVIVAAPHGEPSETNSPGVGLQSPNTFHEPSNQTGTHSPGGIRPTKTF